MQRLPDHLRARAPRIEEVDGRWLFLVEGSPPRRMGPPRVEAKGTGFRAGGSDPDVRAQDLDEDGVWGEVLYPTIALFGFVIPDPELRWATARAYNDWLAETFAAASQAHAMPVSFHVGTGANPVTERGPGGAVINYVEVGLGAQRTLAYLAASGVLERFPALHVVMVECGAGWLSWLLERMDEAFEEHEQWVKPKLAEQIGRASCREREW